MKFSELPALGTALEGGTFAGITTQPDESHHAVILLPETAEKMTWKKAIAWAKNLNADLPSRPVASMLFANVKAQIKPEWHWTSEEEDATTAWGCYFNYGFISYGRISYGRKSYEGSAVAVRLIQIEGEKA